MSDREPTSLRARTRLLEELRDVQRQSQRLAAGGVVAPAESDAAAPPVVQLLRACPPLTDPAWAMEELLRANPNVGVWTGSHLSPAVWAPPGSGRCPFRTTESDFVRHH